MVYKNIICFENPVLCTDSNTERGFSRCCIPSKYTRDSFVNTSKYQKWSYNGYDWKKIYKICYHFKLQYKYRERKNLDINKPNLYPQKAIHKIIKEFTKCNNYK